MQQKIISVRNNTGRDIGPITSITLSSGVAFQLSGVPALPLLMRANNLDDFDLTVSTDETLLGTYNDSVIIDYTTGTRTVPILGVGAEDILGGGGPEPTIIYNAEVEYQAFGS